MDEIMKDYDVSGDNIPTDDNDFYTWRGIYLDCKKQLELFGIVLGDVYQHLEEGLLVIEGYKTEDEDEDNTLFVNGSNLREAISNYTRFLKLQNITSFSMVTIEEFKRIDHIPSTFNIPLILLFDRELKLYFDKK